MMVTMDYRLDRVRIFVDSRGNVKSVPAIGWYKLKNKIEILIDYK